MTQRDERSVREGKKTYQRPETKTISAREIVEELGPAIALYGDIGGAP